ncbi:MAG: mandelate racemase/muconate lactonizing enzyme family protein [Desulfobacterales bacterium]|nr:mandelate racemase/muconate lactonizing enzyme family protein [Desulfobacterales bacterium]
MRNIVNSKFSEHNFSVCIERLEIFVFQAPITTPVRTSFGIMHQRPAVLLRIEDNNGAFGWGEVWCNFPSSAAAYRSALITSELSSIILGGTFTSSGQIYRKLSEDTAVLALQSGDGGALSQAIAGLDIAVWDLIANRLNIPLYQLLGDKHSGVMQPYASGINPDGALQTVQRCRAEGYRAFKVKVGFDPEKDVEIVDEIARNLLPGEHLMIDANQAWSVEEALVMVERFDTYPLDWIEEPLRADRPWSEWARLSNAADIPIALGENLRGTLFFEALDSDAVSVIQPDICKWGGFTGCTPVALSAISRGKRYCPHYLGGGIGLIASAHLLAAVGGDGMLEVDCNQNPLKELLATPFPEFVDGLFRLSEQPGLGVQPDLNAAKDFIVAHDEITK